MENSAHKISFFVQIMAIIQNLSYFEENQMMP